MPSHRLLVFAIPMLLAAAPARASAHGRPARPGTFARPDSAVLAALNQRLGANPRAKVVALSGEYIVIDAVATSEEIRYRYLTLNEGFSYRSLEGGERGAPRLAWSDIESVQARGPRVRSGALLGALVGLVAGVAVGASQPCHVGLIGFEVTDNCASRRMLPVLIGPLVGAALGGLIGARADPWRPLYP